MAEVLRCISIDHEERYRKVLEDLAELAQAKEIARIGFIGDELEVYVRTDDARNVPHVHVRDIESKGDDFEICVQLLKNAYYPCEFYADKLDSVRLKAFAEFMEAPCRNERYATNYEYAVDMWNDNNSSAEIQVVRNPDGMVVIPDYRNIGLK